MNDKNNKLLNGILTICYYNSCEEFIIDLVEFLKNKDLHEEESIIYFEDFANGKYKWNFANPSYENSSLHIIQMLLTNEYGEYGTSPRFGWIPKENYNRLLEDLKNEIETNWQTNDEGSFKKKEGK
jgi:hypothetical protein